MFKDLPILPNKFYNKTSSYMNLYNELIGFGSKTSHKFEETLLIRCIRVIYEDFIYNGFGSDWSRELSKLVELVENNRKLNRYSMYLEKLSKYSKGYHIDKVNINEYSDMLETLLTQILIYVDENRPWKLLNAAITM